MAQANSFGFGQVMQVGLHGGFGKDCEHGGLLLVDDGLNFIEFSTSRK
jgi:hypothetical protein